MNRRQVDQEARASEHRARSEDDYTKRCEWRNRLMREIDAGLKELRRDTDYQETREPF